MLAEGLRATGYREPHTILFQPATPEANCVAIPVLQRGKLRHQGHSACPGSHRSGKCTKCAAVSV